jgi:hypothetical protein
MFIGSCSEDRSWTPLHFQHYLLHLVGMQVCRRLVHARMVSSWHACFATVMLHDLGCNGLRTLHQLQVHDTTMCCSAGGTWFETAWVPRGTASGCCCCCLHALLALQPTHICALSCALLALRFECITLLEKSSAAAYVSAAACRSIVVSHVAAQYMMLATHWTCR